MPAALLAWLLLLPCAGSAEPRIDWDADPMAGLRSMLRGSPQAAVEPEDRVSAAELPEPAARPAAPAPRRPERVPTIRRESPAPDPRAGREFRQVRPLIPIGPACPDGSDPPCAVERPHAPGSLPRGGYYYGYHRGADGKLFYGKLYLPHYGPFDGQAHNDPPGKLRGQTPQLFLTPDPE